MVTLPSINEKRELRKIISLFKSVQKKSKSSKIVIGLSGGVDSTTTLYLLKKSYKTKDIFAVYMPYSTKLISIFDRQLNKIKKIIKKTRIPKKNFFVVPLKKPADNIIDRMKTLGKKGLDKLICEIKECFTCPNTDYLNKVRVGNMMARLRMLTLFDIAKKINALVCGTENKSEQLLGYFTRFGDAASDIEPISHLYKTQVYELARYLKVPKIVIDAAPTAGLWDGQTDENELGFTYKEADQILYLHIEKRKSLPQIKKLGYKNTGKIIKRVSDYKFKHDVPYSLGK